MHATHNAHKAMHAVWRGAHVFTLVIADGEGAVVAAVAGVAVAAALVAVAVAAAVVEGICAGQQARVAAHEVIGGADHLICTQRAASAHALT